MSRTGSAIRWMGPVACALLGLAFVSPATVGASNAKRPQTDWEKHGLDDSEARYSLLNEINRDSVSRLGLAWSLDLPGENSLEATPLEVNGVIYFSGGIGVIYAVSVETGKLLWSHDPKAGEKSEPGRRLGLPVNRGVAYADGKVFVATRDGRMTAVNAKTGKPVWETQFLITGDNASSTGAPRVCGRYVMIGNAGAESLARGYTTAMNLKTGKIAWRFYSVPGNPAVDKDETTRIASDTWSGEWWKYGGGGTPWAGMTCDEKLGQFIIGTGNGGGPLALRSKGIQPNLFLDSMVAVDLATGKYKWHYQYNTGEEWDWKATTEIILDTMVIDGKEHQVAIQAPSNGFIYVIDRQTGKLLQAKEWAKQNWALGIDMATGRPIERPDIHRVPGAPLRKLYPGPIGAHNWQVMSYNPETNIAYIPYMQLPNYIRYNEAVIDLAKNPLKKGFLALVPAPNPNKPKVTTPAKPLYEDDDPKDFTGALVAWDVKTQKEIWRVDYPFLWNGGTLVTKGDLVFQGLESGKINAYDSKSGKQLWSFDAQHGVMAPPITYTYKGHQYISILAGYGGSGGFGAPQMRAVSWNYGDQPRRLLTFRLDGTATLPPTPPRRDPDSIPAIVKDVPVNPEKLARGTVLFLNSCLACHDAGGIGTGAAPDLRASGIAADRDTFKLLLRGGYLANLGMPKFDDLTDDEIDGIYEYIRQSASNKAPYIPGAHP